MYKFKFLAHCLLLGVFFTVLQSSSCKKDDPAPVPKTKKELLILASWKLVKGEFRTSTSLPWTDGTSSVPVCQRDNVTTYKTDGSYEIDEGATKCTPTAPQMFETGNWVFQNNETELKTTRTGSATSIIWGIEQISETSLILTGSGDLGGTTYFLRSTFGH